MFLTNTPNTIQDFLTAINFVPPKGMDVSYFIVPISQEVDQQIFDKEFPKSFGTYEQSKPINNTQNVPGTTDNLTYTKKQLLQTHSFNNANFNIAAQPGPMPKTLTKPELLTSNIEIYGGQIDSSQKLNRTTNQITESSVYSDSIDIMLKETWNGFPKHTIFHCIKNKLAEQEKLQQEKDEKVKHIMEQYNYCEITQEETLKLIETTLNCSKDKAIKTFNSFM